MSDRDDNNSARIDLVDDAVVFPVDPFPEVFTTVFRDNPSELWLVLEGPHYLTHAGNPLLGRQWVISMNAGSNFA